MNETTRYRIIGLTLETRPDHINEAEIKNLRRLGCTRVQLGIQHTDDKILELIRRGDTLANAVKSTRLLKEAGFKVDMHFMPDLPGSTPKKDLEMFKYVFISEDLQPDQLKIYPYVVNEHAQLWHWFKNGKYQPYSEKELMDLLIEVKKLTPPYVRINRLVRDIPKESITAGNSITNLRQYLQQELNQQGGQCMCIRCREPRAQSRGASTAIFKTRIYRASVGTEYFLSYESKDEKTIYAFCRLRFNDSPDDNFIPELQGASLVRELHVYGQMTPVDQLATTGVQHLGFGSKLMALAEKITKEKGLEKVAVISGIGVREYYRMLGYQLEGTYMVKYLGKL
ncbi:MAG: tRNA uridine(34) 5-carboxymethylaminomethyl modification radical SAM/GNAT enzyme Elp3 [Candidatus Komeilibacteria bacterium]